MELMLELQRQRQGLGGGLLHHEEWLPAIGSNQPRSSWASCHPDAEPSS